MPISHFYHSQCCRWSISQTYLPNRTQEYPIPSKHLFNHLFNRLFQPRMVLLNPQLRCPIIQTEKDPISEPTAQVQTCFCLFPSKLKKEKTARKIKLILMGPLYKRLCVMVAHVPDLIHSLLCLLVGATWVHFHGKECPSLYTLLQLTSNSDIQTCKFLQKRALTTESRSANLHLLAKISRTLCIPLCKRVGNSCAY